MQDGCPGVCMGRQQAWMSLFIVFWPCFLHSEIKTCTCNPKFLNPTPSGVGVFLQESGKPLIGNPGPLSYYNSICYFCLVGNWDREYD